MNMLYNPNAPKKPTNLSLNSDLVNKAKQKNINISSIVESAIAEELKRHHENSWKIENKISIENYNQFVDSQGLFSDDVRGF